MSVCPSVKFYAIWSLYSLCRIWGLSLSLSLINKGVVNASAAIENLGINKRGYIIHSDSGSGKQKWTKMGGFWPAMLFDVRCGLIWSQSCFQQESTHTPLNQQGLKGTRCNPYQKYMQAWRHRWLSCNKRTNLLPWCQVQCIWILEWLRYFPHKIVCPLGFYI